MPVSVLERLKQDCQELEASLGYRAGPCLKSKYRNLKQQSKLVAPKLGKSPGPTQTFQIQTQGLAHAFPAESLFLGVPRGF